MSRPTVSTTAEQVYADLGPALAKDDSGWLLLGLVDALTLGLVAVDALARDGARPGWVDLFDVDLCPPQYLPWLAQWAGVRYDPTVSADGNRARIRAREGSTAGTPRELVEAVRSRLAGGAGIVRLLERDTGPHHVTVQTFAAQTPDPDRVRAAIAAVKPARVLVDLQVLTSATYNDLRVAAAPSPGVTPTYAQLRARFPTYGAMTAYIPGA